MAQMDQSSESPSTARLRPSSIPAGSERVNPALAQFVQFDDLIRETRAIRRLLEAQVPIGKTFEIEATVTTSTWERILLVRPVFAMTIVNDGPGVVDWNLGGDYTPSTLNAGEDDRVSYNNPVIVEVWIRLAAGAAGAIRLKCAF